jgi:5-dehydro-4-deoxyglucarate dehydratase
MSQVLVPEQVRKFLMEGVQAFPLTDFDSSGEFSPAPFRRRIEWMQSHNPSALFVAGGAGEFFSLTPREYSAVVSAAISVRKEGMPIVAAAGYGTKTAIEYAQEAERLGADAILLLPPYLTESSQAGLHEHISRLCAATRLAVIVYNRANCRLQADTLRNLVASCPNLIGFKDGIGNIEELIAIKSAVDSKIAIVNGMPTAEIYAASFRSIGVRSYSSAVFSFSPEIAKRFYSATVNDDESLIASILEKFFAQYCRLRAKQPGYAVSIVKAGARITGHSAGKVRPPLSELTADEERNLAGIINEFQSSHELSTRYG